ncbi:transmembrane and coiled-coil domain-containing protein 6 [Osmerus mordax]|uniref:transmembrane and coiled-coil domain-containing protein 6 n=1 Tax=Osmerus mordax TaxID=8014 RepID=UPI00350F53EA
MWRLNTVRHKAGRKGCSLEELKFKRRDHEKELRQARKDRQLVSKRLLLNEDDEVDSAMDIQSSDQVVELFLKVLNGGEERGDHLSTLRKALRNPSTHLLLIKQENSMHVLVGLLSGSNAQCRLEAVRCLHELSHSPHPSVGPACLPATPYLLTYLSGQSAKFTELCLYTLGNLCPDSDAIVEKLLAQGLIPALANCIQIQRSSLAVVEAVGFTLSQLLQAKHAAEKISPLVLASGLVPHLLSVLTVDPQFGLSPAIECAWCLHYLICSNVDNGALLVQGTLSQCSALLVTLGGAVAEGTKQEGIELLIWPLLRCVGNLLSSRPLRELEPQLRDARLLATLCAFTLAFLQTQPALARESTWVLNNITADSSRFCSALLFLNLVPSLIQMLPFSRDINTMVLRILGNVAHKGSEYCIQLVKAGLLPALCATLKMADQEMVTLSLEVLLMLLSSSPQVAEEFVKQSGQSLLEAIQYNSEGEMRLRATYLLENNLTLTDL